jgi:hypothetical protein
MGGKDKDLEFGESPILEYTGYAGYLSHGMIGSAATLTSKITYKGGQRMANGIVKSAVEITEENAEIWGTVAEKFNIFGGALGAGVNGFKVYHDLERGQKGWATFHGSVALGYTLGVIITIVCPECGYGEYLLISTMVADMAGDGVKAFKEQ